MTMGTTKHSTMKSKIATAAAQCLCCRRRRHQCLLLSTQQLQLCDTMTARHTFKIKFMNFTKKKKKKKKVKMKNNSRQQNSLLWNEFALQQMEIRRSDKM